MNRLKLIFLIVISLITLNGYAQFGLINDCAYFFTFRPVVGTMSTSTDISHGVNSTNKIEAKGLTYGVDLLNATWTYVEGAYLVPQIQVPVKLRYMQTSDNGLRISDGTVLPNKNNPAFYTIDLGVGLYYSPIYFRFGEFVISPKLGVGFDFAKHNYEIDFSKFIGKDGTNPTLQTQINGVLPSAPIYSVSFWEDLYGFNLGTYINIGSRFIIEASWEYYPIRFIIKNVGNSSYDDFGGDDYMEATGASSASLSRLGVEARWNILTNVAAFAKYESSNYRFGFDGGISTGPGVLLDKKTFNQYDYSLLFGVAVVFAQ